MSIEQYINKHSDYTSYNPHWINLHRDVDGDDVRKAMSDGMLEFFEKYGPDACEDFTSYESCSLQYSTAERALKYAIRKNKKLCGHLFVHELIDGGFSMESDGRVNDPVTGRLLHEIPINDDSTINELEALLDQDSISKDDWVFIHYAYNSFGDWGDDRIIRLVRDLVIKFH